MSLGLIFSCEHASPRVPEQWARLFESRRAKLALSSHWGWDPGALSVAKRLSQRFGAPLHAGSVTRLLVDLNRSLNHPRLFSQLCRKLDEGERRRILQRYYVPYRNRVERGIRSSLKRHRCVLHLSVHSFTPRLGGHERRTDIGLLYDPRRRTEQTFCSRFKAALAVENPELVVRRNYPYRGSDDGLTRQLRQRFDASEYLGVELELNQARLTGSVRATRALLEPIGSALEQVVRTSAAGA